MEKSFLQQLLICPKCKEGMAYAEGRWQCHAGPAKVLSKFNGTREVAGRIPFNFGKGLFSLRGDLYDRFGASYEYRYRKSDLEQWHQQAQSPNPYFTKLDKRSGWVTMGHKGGADA